MNMDYCLSELKALLSIDSPSGFTDSTRLRSGKNKKGRRFLLPRRRG